MAGRAHVHTTDTQWMEWLRKCSRRTGTSGQTLYEEYGSSDKTPWRASIHELKTVLCPGWFFCRGAVALSSADIASARHRYLDRYPLTAENRDSGQYIDELLEVDMCQTRLRRCPLDIGGCPGCLERDRTISRLNLALSADGIVDESLVEGKMLTSIFRRYFMMDGVSTTSRTEVRETIEGVLRQEIGPDETLAVSSPQWSTFLRNTLGMSGANSRPIRCRLRSCPIEPQGVI